MEYVYMLQFKYFYERIIDEKKTGELVASGFFLGVFTSREEAEETIPFYLTLEGFREFSREEFMIYRFAVDKKYIPAMIVEFDGW
jgi:hypothetical protein